jgi:flagellar hook-length control protein FliK
VIAPGSATILETTPSAAPPAGGSSITGTPAFDAILMLQNLAATAETLDTASLEPAETIDLLAGDDDTDDEELGDELEASLAFLSELLNATTPKTSSRDFGAGAQSQGDAPAESELATISAKGAAPEFSDAADAAQQAATDETGDARLLLTAVKPEPLDNAAKSTEATQNLARAAELLSSPGRPQAATADKHVTTHVRDPRWADDFSSRVALMVRGAESSASMQLTPADLGPVEVNVTVKDSQATVHFGASQADTRALIEASLPRLRELLASQGFNLTDASVSSGFNRSHRGDNASSGTEASEVEPAGTEIRTVRNLGLLDVYA